MERDFFTFHMRLNAVSTGLEERIYRPKQDQDTDTDEDAALRGLQIALHHRHDGRHHVRLA